MDALGRRGVRDIHRAHCTRFRGNPHGPVRCLLQAPGPSNLRQTARVQVGHQVPVDYKVHPVCTLPAAYLLYTSPSEPSRPCDLADGFANKNHRPRHPSRCRQALLFQVSGYSGLPCYCGCGAFSRLRSRPCRVEWTLRCSPAMRTDQDWMPGYSGGCMFSSAAFRVGASFAI